MRNILGQKVSTLSSSDLHRHNLKPYREILMWDHIHMTPRMQQLFRKIWLSKLNLPATAELKIFLVNTVTNEIKHQAAVEYFFERDKNVSWGIFLRREDYWELRHILLPAKDGLSFWSGSQIAHTDLFWVTVAKVRETYPDPEFAKVNAGGRVTQEIVLYELDLESGNLVPKLDKSGKMIKLEPDNNYLSNQVSPQWRDPSPILNICSDDSEDYLTTGTFCAMDQDRNPCVGVFEFHTTPSGKIKPYLKPPLELPESAKYLIELECPIMLMTDDGEYLFASTQKKGHHALVVWFRAKGKDSWVETNQGQNLQPNYPEGYTLYAGSLKIKNHNQVFLSGWIGRDGLVYAQSNDFEVVFDGEQVQLKEVHKKPKTNKLSSKLSKLPKLLKMGLPKKG